MHYECKGPQDRAIPGALRKVSEGMNHIIGLEGEKIKSSCRIPARVEMAKLVEKATGKTKWGIWIEKDGERSLHRTYRTADLGDCEDEAARVALEHSATLVLPGDTDGSEALHLMESIEWRDHQNDLRMMGKPGGF